MREKKAFYVCFMHNTMSKNIKKVRKITKNVAHIKYCLENNLNFSPLCVGNIYAKRDWSDAEDFVDGVWKMLNNDTPEEYVLSSGETHSVKEFITTAFKELNINGFWEGKGKQVGIRMGWKIDLILKNAENARIL